MSEPAVSDSPMNASADEPEPALPEPPASQPPVSQPSPSPSSASRSPAFPAPVSAAPVTRPRVATSPRGPAPPLVNVANGLTLLRIVLVPVFVVLMVASGMTEPGYRIAAALAFGVASLTDFADGWIARAFNQVTSFGKVADPIADKALTGTALVLLSIYGAPPWWVTVVILARELGVTALRFWVLRHGVIAASRGGKAKTVLQIAAIAWYIWPFGPTLAMVGPWLMLLAVVVTVLTGADYVARALRVRRLSRQ